MIIYDKYHYIINNINLHENECPCYANGYCVNMLKCIIINCWRLRNNEVLIIN